MHQTLIKRLTLFAVCTLLVINGFGQIRPEPFSTEPELFIKELQDFLKLAQKKDYDIAAVKFAQVWNTYSENQKAQVMLLCNDMVHEKVALTPSFGDYIQTLNAINYNNQQEQYFGDFHNLLNKLFKLNKAYFREMTGALIPLFNSGHLYKTATLNWQTAGPFTLHVDSASKPYITFDQTDLSMSFVKDSTTIYKTKGSYYPIDLKWYGKGGKTDWSRVGLRADSIYVELNTYYINLRQSGFTSDSATFHNPKIFTKPLLGKFEDKGMPAMKPEKADFPKFVCYEEAITLLKVLPGVDYYGKFAIEGQKFYCLGNKDNVGKLTFYKNGTRAVYAQAIEFILGNEDIKAQHCAVSLSTGNDSVFHSDVYFKYLKPSKEVVLTRNDDINNNAFYSSFHNLDIACDQLSWKLDSSKINFSMRIGQSDAFALFTSKNYYNEFEFDEIKGITNYHPLTKLYVLQREWGTMTLPAETFAASIGLKLDNVRDLLIRLAREGFIFYNRETETITVKEKTIQYVTAKSKKIDYDSIRIKSAVGSRLNNGEIDLSTNYLKVYGVKIVLLSDSHQVYIMPRNKELIVKEGLNMELSGRVLAGPLDFTGNGFFFDYEKFSLKMDNVDSLKFRIATGEVNRDGRKKYALIRTVLENINGELQLDDPNNKSGLKSFKEYPIFKTTKISFIYYEYEDILKRTYQKDSFFFQVDPFTLDSLDYITLNKGLEFKGTLVSANIFPNINEIVKLQPDTTFGFVTRLPQEGLPVYGNKGRFYNELTLNSSGLIGAGKLTYLNAVATSPKLVFTPDTAFAVFDSLYIPTANIGKYAYPKVTGSNLKGFWKPYSDTLSLKSQKTPISLFEKNYVTFMGKYNYTPTGSSGLGRVLFESNEVESNYHTFTSSGIVSDSSTLKIASQDKNLWAFYSQGLKSNIDFDQQKGSFNSHGDKAKVELQYNELNSILNNFYWDLTRQEFVLGNKNSTIAETRFETTNPNRKGLAFDAAYATIDLLKYQLNAYGVKGLEVADALIQPEGAKLLIEKGARIEPLENAKIILQSDKLSRTIYNAKAIVLDGERFTGEGYYDYANLSDTIQQVFFNAIVVSDSLTTIASGNIEDSTFMINPGFSFIGNMKLLGTSAKISFKGITKLTELPSEINSVSFKIDALANPKENIFNLPDAIYDGLGNEIYVGIFWDQDTRAMYPLVMGTKYTRTDFAIIEGKGAIEYDIKGKRYNISSLYNLENHVKYGNYIEVLCAEKSIGAQGQFTFTNEMEKIKCLNSGTMTYPLNSNEVTFKIANFTQMALPNSAMKLMTNLLFDATYPLPEFKASTPLVYEAISNLIPEASTRTKVKEELESYGTFPSSFPYSFVFSEINLVFDQTYRSFHSTGPLGIASINGEVINKMVPGAFEIIGSGETLSYSLLIEPKTEIYYLLEYNNFKADVGLVSSEMEFNQELLKKAAKKDKKGGDENKNTFSLGLTDNKDLLKERVK